MSHFINSKLHLKVLKNKQVCSSCSCLRNWEMSTKLFLRAVSHNSGCYSCVITGYCSSISANMYAASYIYYQVLNFIFTYSCKVLV